MLLYLQRPSNIIAKKLNIMKQVIQYGVNSTVDPELKGPSVP